MPSPNRCLALAAAGLTLSGGLLLPSVTSAQIGPAVTPSDAWQACLQQPDRERLAWFDAWAAVQQGARVAPEERSWDGAQAEPATASAGEAEELPSGPVGVAAVGVEQGCRDRSYTETSRFWELEAGSSCPTFGLRAYHPNTVAVAFGRQVNRQPVSGNPANSAAGSGAYQKQEMRFTVSVRTKLVSGLFTPREGSARDSLWLAYTQQSYWQVFNGGLSRPFRNTDYMPELVYVYPTTMDLPGGWRWRYTGLGLLHHSNGQGEPLSRSWNRVYAMAGFEKGNRLQLQLRLWKRIPENSARDDNPGITRYMGRGDLVLGWNVDRRNHLRTTLTGSRHGRGSGRLEWTYALGEGRGNTASGLRLYTGLFHGYGDSLIDYNFKRTVFSIGLSLVDF